MHSSAVKKTKKKHLRNSIDCGPHGIGQFIAQGSILWPSYCLLRVFYNYDHHSPFDFDRNQIYRLHYSHFL